MRNILAAIFMLISTYAGAVAIKADKIHGELTSVQLDAADSIENIARSYDVAYDEVLQANPNVNPKVLHKGDILTIPSQRLFIADSGAKMVVNLQELRLYLRGDLDESYPVAIGREDWDTPQGLFSIIGKKYLPSWYVPKDILEEFAEQDIILPEVIEPGPDNPLGKYLIRLSMPSYLIHGTNDPDSIGKKTTSGCVSLYPEDIEQLYKKVEIGDYIKIISAPIKWYQNHDALCVEVHLLDSDAAYVEDFKNRFNISKNDQEYWDSIFAEGLGVPQCVKIRRA